MQLSVNIPEIAATLKRDTVEGVPVSLMTTLFGEEWVVPYDQWPAELQAEYSYDPDLAIELLAEAAADGAFTPNDAGGFDCDILASSTDDMELLQAIQSYFSDIGVKMDINAVDQMTFYSMAHSQSFDYMTFASVGGLVSGPATCIMKFTPTSSQNTGGVNDPAYTAIVEQFQAAATITEAQELFKEAERYMLEQHWVVSMCANSNPQVWQSWVKGYSGEFLWTVWGLQYFAYMWVDES